MGGFDLGGHWDTIVKLAGLTIVTPFVPRLWRGIVRVCAAPFLLEIERERRKALEERVADLLLEQDELEAERDRERERRRR